jgi:hypothetical protein
MSLQEYGLPPSAFHICVIIISSQITKLSISHTLLLNKQSFTQTSTVLPMGTEPREPRKCQLMVTAVVVVFVLLQLLPVHHVVEGKQYLVETKNAKAAATATQKYVNTSCTFFFSGKYTVLTETYFKVRGKNSTYFFLRSVNSFLNIRFSNRFFFVE